jgi:hypothetical protein
MRTIKLVNFACVLSGTYFRGRKAFKLKLLTGPTWIPIVTRQATYCNVTLRCIRATFGAVEKQVLRIMSVFVALGIYHAMRMRHIVICGLPACTTFFSTLFHKRHDFRKKIIGHKICILIFVRKISNSKKN